MCRIFYSSCVFVLLLLQLTAAAQQKQKVIKYKKHDYSKAVNNEDMLSDLQGKWASLQDKKSFFVIREHQQQNFYSDKVVDTSFINFYNKCPKSVSDKDGLTITGRYMVIRNKDYRFKCYRIVRLNVQDLVLLQEANGKLLRFKKQYYR